MQQSEMEGRKQCLAWVFDCLMLTINDCLNVLLVDANFLDANFFRFFFPILHALITVDIFGLLIIRQKQFNCVFCL